MSTSRRKSCGAYGPIRKLKYPSAGNGAVNPRRLRLGASPAAVAMAWLVLTARGFAEPAADGSGGCDWPQWRGPGRNGAVPGGPSLSTDWGTGGPAKLWESETILGGSSGGCGSPVVAAGWVYVYSNLRPKKRDKDTNGYDRVFCLDAADGKTVWKYEADGNAKGFSGSSTVAVVDGKVYFTGSLQQLGCLDATNGKKLWETQFYEKCGRFGYSNSSPLVADGVVVVMADMLVGLNAEDGSILWKQPKTAGKTHYESSPALWHNGGNAYAICNGAAGVVCVGLKTGKLKWTLPGARKAVASVVVAGDILVVQSHKKVGLCAYKLSPDKPELLWSQPTWIAVSASPAVDGQRVYAMPKGLAACLNLADGTIVWQQELGKIDTYSESKNRMPDGWTSPVIGDGKVFVIIKGILYVLATDRDTFAVLATFSPTGNKRGMGMSGYANPALVNGRLYMRLSKSIACYDLTAAAP